MLPGCQPRQSSSLSAKWASRLCGERLWPIEDYRQLTRALERELIERGEEL